MHVNHIYQYNLVIQMMSHVTKEANEECFVFLLQHGGYDVNNVRKSSSCI